MVQMVAQTAVVSAYKSEALTRTTFREPSHSPTQPVLFPKPFLIMSKLQGLVTKGFIRPNLSNAVLDLNKWVEERQKTVPNFRYYTVGGLAAVLQGQQRATRVQRPFLFPTVL